MAQANDWRTRLGSLLAALVRNPVLGSITPLGWALLVGGLGCAIVGWNRGWLEFQTLAILAGIILVISLMFVLRRREHQAVLELHRPRVQVGEEAMGHVLVRCAGGKASAPTTIELPVAKAVAAFRVGALGVDDEHEEIFTIPTRRRGIVPLGPVRSVLGDPVGVISRHTALTEATELYIHPKIVAVEPAAIGLLKDIEGITTANLSSSDVSFHALREYLPGDDRRSVHWKTTARVGRLMVRQFEETMRAHLLLLWSTLRTDYATDEDFELAVSVVGSLAASALREERQVSVATSVGEITFPNSLGLLDKLSGIEPAERGHDLRQLAVRSGDLPGVSVAGFITGGCAPANIRAAQLAIAPGVQPFAVRCVAGQELARKKIGELTILDIAELAQLRPALRSL